MADISLRGPICCGSSKSDDDLTSYLKFSGLVVISENPQTLDVGDAGAVNIDTDDLVAYPIARRGKLKDLAVNISTFVVPVDGSIIVQLYRNGSPLSDFIVEYEGGETGIKSVHTKRKKFRRGDTLELRITTDGIDVENVVPLAATVGVVG